MNIRGEVDRIEARLAACGLTATALCDRAGVARSTWTRWKAGRVVPNFKTWMTVTGACDALCAEAAASGEAAS